MQLIGGKDNTWESFMTSLKNLHCLVNGGAAIKTEGEINSLINELCLLRIRWVALNQAMEGTLTSGLLITMDHPEVLDEYELFNLICLGSEATAHGIHSYQDLLKRANPQDARFIRDELIPWLVKEFDLRVDNFEADIPITRRVYKRHLDSCEDCPLFFKDTKQCGHNLSPTEGRIISPPYLIPVDCNLSLA